MAKKWELTQKDPILNFSKKHKKVKRKMDLSQKPKKTTTPTTPPKKD